MKQFWIIASLISLSLFTTNCTKEDWTPDSANLTAQPLTPTATIDDTTAHFLQIDYISGVNPYLLPKAGLRSTHPLIEKAIIEIEEANTRQGFIQQMTRKYGYPIWDRSEVLETDSGGEMLFTPLAFEDSRAITAFLSGTPKGDIILFRLVTKKKMDQAIKRPLGQHNWSNLPFSVVFTTELDQLLFRNPSAEYLDWFWNVYVPGARAQDDVLSPRSCTEESTTRCYDEPIALMPGGAVSLRSQTCVTFVETVCDSPDSSCQECTGGGSTDGGSSSGGSSGISGASEYEETIVDNASTPCVKNIIEKIKDSSFGSDLFVEILRDVFDISTDVNITIAEEQLPKDTDGESTYTYTQIYDLLIFDGEITLNSLYTGTASEDWILATIIHEAIHSYIHYNQALVETGEMTQNEFERLFPLFTMDDTGHLTMGLAYVNKIADILQRNNPNLSEHEALSLSRVGLSSTGYWAFGLNRYEKGEAIRINKIGRGEETSSSSTQKQCP